LVHHPQIGLVYQRGGLQGVIGAFAGDVIARHPAKFFINERHQFLRRSSVAATPIFQDWGDVWWRIRTHCLPPSHFSSRNAGKRNYFHGKCPFRLSTFHFLLSTFSPVPSHL